MTSQSTKKTTPVDQKSESIAGKVRLATIKLDMGSVAEDSEKDSASYLIKHEKKDGIQQWKRRFKEEERKSRRWWRKEGKRGNGQECQDLLDLPEQPASRAADDGGLLPGPLQLPGSLHLVNHPP